MDIRISLIANIAIKAKKQKTVNLKKNGNGLVTVSIRINYSKN